MKPEIAISIISFLIILICFFVYRYNRLKQQNYYIKRKYNLLIKIGVYEKLISKRYLYLSRYNFQTYNLNESLIIQEIPNIEENDYFR